MAKRAKRVPRRRPAKSQKKGPKRVRAIPAGFHTATPGLTVRGAAEAIEFYKRAFGAQELMRMPGPDGKSLVHAEIKIGNSVIFLNDEMPDMGCRSPQTLGASTAALHLYVPDVDAAFKRAVEAGAQVKMPVADMFWGDRFGRVADPFGHEWGLATHKEDLTPQAMAKRAQDFFAQMPKTS
jgi:PhnB protein